MAGGNSPRQKMINLMYLVFIAMLALNMDKAVLGAFGLMKEKFESSAERADKLNIASFNALERSAKENYEQYGEAFQKSKVIKKLSDEYYTYINDLKNQIMSVAKDPKDYQVMDTSDFLDQKFFASDGLKEEGKEFVQKMENFRDTLIKELSANGGNNTELIERLKSTFNTDPVVNREGLKVGWLSANFQGFPYIASVAKLSMIEYDIREAEQGFYNIMLAEEMKSQISMTNYTTLLEQSKGAFYEGEQFEGAIVLGRKDGSTRPNAVELSLDGTKLSSKDYEIKDGKVKIKVNAGSTGEHTIKGNLYFDQDGKRIAVLVDQKFSTIPKPNSAVISADKMNVVYRGVANPITISMPGVPDNKVTASAPGLSKASGSNYVMRPGQGREVTINVSGEIDGEVFSSSKAFRIKDIPRPSGAISGMTGSAGALKLPKANLSVATITAVLEDFDFDLKLSVNSFKIFVPGQPTVSVNGNKLDNAAKSALNRARRGDMVQIFDIKASVVGNSSYRLPNVSPVAVEITN